MAPFRNCHEASRQRVNVLVTRAVIILLVVFAASGPSSAAQVPALTPDFARWLESRESVTYGEVARRFVAAGGRDAGSYEASVRSLATQFAAAEKAAGSPTTPTARADLLRKFLFQRQGFSADLNLQSVANLFPDSILARKRGYCLGLTLLVLDLGERLGWRMTAASAPRHTFVRLLGGATSVNVETTLGGVTHDDQWYVDRFGLGSTGGTKLLQGLTPRQTAAHLLNNHGFALLELGDPRAAERQFHAALRVMPELTEAGINLGVLEARKGRHKEALRWFGEALRQWPGDAVLLLNRANALCLAGRWSEAAADAVRLCRRDKQVKGLEALVSRLKQRLHPESDWAAVQGLACAHNEQRAQEDGRKSGLLGSYYRDQHLGELAMTRIDRDLSFQWGRSQPARALPRDHFSVRWEGWLQAPSDDEYTFLVKCSDGARVWIDGREVVSAWSGANGKTSRGSVTLQRGLHSIRVEYFEDTGPAEFSVVLTARKREDALDFAELLSHCPEDFPAPKK